MAFCKIHWELSYTWLFFHSLQCLYTMGKKHKKHHKSDKLEKSGFEGKTFTPTSVFCFWSFPLKGIHTPPDPWWLNYWIFFFKTITVNLRFTLCSTCKWGFIRNQWKGLFGLMRIYESKLWDLLLAVFTQVIEQPWRHHGHFILGVYTMFVPKTSHCYSFED